MPAGDSLSIIIPVFNGEQTLAELVGELSRVLPSLSRRHEVILVNDGSGDRSWEAVRDLAAHYPFVRGLNLTRNCGQHNALLCGIRAARNRVIVTMDDDLQHPPAEIPKLLAALDSGSDVVYGVPEEMSHSLWRNVLSALTKRALAHAMGIRNIRDINAFRAFRAELRDAFAGYQSPHVMLDVLLSWGTSRFTTVTVRHQQRKAGTSNYTLGKLFNQAMLVLTGFSTGPLRLASILGFGCTLFGAGVLFYVVVRYLREGSVSGFPFLASIIAIFSGVQLFSLGVIGEYLARMFHRSMERPPYVVRDDIGRGDS